MDLPFDDLSDPALAVAMELRRLEIGLMVDRRSKRRVELFFIPPPHLHGSKFPPGLLDRVRPHVTEIVELIERGEALRRAGG